MFFETLQALGPIYGNHWQAHLPTWDVLKRNPIGNRAISGFKGQKSFIKYITVPFAFSKSFKGHCHDIWQLYKKPESVFASVQFQN